MTQNNINSQENARLNALRNFDILDTLTEKDYDEITLLASSICEAPVALISFVDEKRQWFKSHHGLSVSETDRAYSFCSHAIKNPHDPFIIPDSHLDDRFRDNPLVTGDPHIGFYAGVPIVSDDGFGIGTVCVLDSKPRILTEHQVSALKMLALQVTNLLKLRKSNKELQLAKDQLQKQHDELQNYSNNLELKIEERVSELAERNADLESANKELKSFNYISSHDLQEPLRKIQTFCSWLVEKEIDNFSDRGKDYLLKIGQSSHRLSSLFDDLLAYSGTTMIEKKFENVSLRNVVEEIETDIKQEFSAKKIELSVVNDCEISVIPHQFRQLLYNVISNSVKFAKSDVDPKIHIDFISDCRHSDSNKSYLKIVIRDNGIGFEKEYNEKVFELFAKLGSRYESAGTGIGLSIARKIADNHGGLIFAEGSENEGTVVKIYLPQR